MEQALNNATHSLGQLLRETREGKGFSLEAVAKKLRINKRHLEKLENDPETLTCDVYTLGFLRSYAQFLNLNAGDLIQQLRDKTTYIPLPQLTFPVPLPERDRPSFRILFLSFFVLAALILGYEWFGKGNYPFYAQMEVVAADAQSPQEPKVVESIAPQVPISPQPIEPLPQNNIAVDSPATTSLTPQEIPVPSITAPPEIMAPLVSALPAQGVVLKAQEKTWVEVKDAQGNVMLNRLFYPDETFEFKDPQNLVLKTGNASGVHLSSGEKNLSFPERQGEVIGNIPLNPVKWEEYSVPKGVAE